MRTACTIVIVLTVAVPVRAEDRRSTTVGMLARIDQLVLPGPELEVVPLDERQPVVLRIVETYPHGTAYRYDLEYYGLEPGKFDLKHYLRRADGSSTADLPALPVEITPLLPPGQVEPNALTVGDAPLLGGYQVLLIAAGVLWVAGFIAILLVGRRKKVAHAQAAQRPLTLADRLRPLVEQALAGKLTTAQQAELERMLLAHWRKRLGLEGLKPAQAMTALRSHDEAGQIVRQLEAWLHAPGDAAKADVNELLSPYRNIPAEEATT